jgi:hypothetical protein
MVLGNGYFFIKMRQGDPRLQEGEELPPSVLIAEENLPKMGL